MIETKNIRLILIDDHPVVLEGLSKIFNAFSTINVVGSFLSAHEAIEFIKTNTVEVVLVDIFLKETNGLDLIQEIKNDFPNIFCIAISSQAERSFVLQALQNGASGYLLKNSSLDEILLNVNQAVLGEIVFSREIRENILVGKSIDINQIPKITKREKEIIMLLAEGKSTQEIAEILFLSYLTVQTHRRNILQKFKVKNVAELIDFCNKNRLV